MKRFIVIIGVLVLYILPLRSWAFTCVTNDGATIPIGGGTANVYVNLAPFITPNENLVVDLSTQIRCHNDSPEVYTDYVSLQQGSAYGGVLENFRGTVVYNGSRYPFPTTSQTGTLTYDSRTPKPWPITLYLTPIGTASGVVINSGDLIAILVLHLRNSGNLDDDYIWRVYARNTVVMPTGGCDISARDITVELPEYPGTTEVPLTIHCAQNQRIGFSLSGSTTDSARTVFTNTASSSKAQGIGIQLKRQGVALPTNSTISIGNVNSSSVDLGLTANYARTSGQVTAGNVQSIINLTFVYL
ncbi:TPA: fimbrial protein [Klebsiella quasipneumoniae subsp. similipneumoniae]